MARALALLALLALPLAAADSIGDSLYRTYTKYDSLPSSAADALAQGWHARGACEENLGVRYTFDADGPTKDHPIVLFFTPAGQATGTGVMAYGEMPRELIQKGFWQETENEEEYFISVTFRAPSDVCAQADLAEPLGDRLVVNQNTIALSIPTREDDPALLDSYAKGSCFKTMGTHWFHDLVSGSTMSWEAANLMPVVPMYDQGRIHAFFFASWTVQQSIIHGSRWWEPVPLPNFAMCKNWCDKECTFSGTWVWSTMHIYLRDPQAATCPGGCTMACCESKSTSSAAYVAPVALGSVAAAGILLLVGLRSRKTYKSKLPSDKYVSMASKPSV